MGWALYALVVYIVATSVLSLASAHRPESSPAGIALAVAALLVMPVLWRWRLGLAGRLESPALRADAACSLVCIYLSATLLVGPAAEPSVRLVVGRSAGGAGDDLVDPRRGRRGARGGPQRPARGLTRTLRSWWVAKGDAGVNGMLHFR